MEQLIQYLISRQVLMTKGIIKAFLAVDRRKFVANNQKRDAYRDYPLPIGYGQTISQPMTVAIMLELLEPELGHKILDIGSGSGWTTALLSKVVGKNGQVIGTEIIPELVQFGTNNIKKFHIVNAAIHQAEKTIGWPKKSPYDRILVSAAAKKLPKELIEQLKLNGVLVIPIQNTIYKIKKYSNKKIAMKKYPGFVFVPLIEGVSEKNI